MPSADDLQGQPYDPSRHRSASTPAPADAAAEQLRASEARYRSLFANMTEGFALGEAICDEAGSPCDFRFLEMNDAFERQSGLSRDKAMGRPMREVLPHLEQYWIDEYCAVALGAPARRFENYNSDLDRHFSVYCFSPVHGQFAILFSDITETKRSQEALRQALKAADEERRRLAAVFEALPAGVAIADATGRITQANAGIGRIWGDPPPPSGVTDYRGWRGWWYETGERLDAEDWAMARALRTGQVIPGDVIEIEKFDGSGRATIINAAAPIRNADGEIVGGVVAEVDITAQKRAEEALRESDRRKDEFIAILSHELRNPLAPIRFAVPVLQRESLSGPARQAVEVIGRQVEHLTRLVDDLLDASRISRGKVELRRERVTLGAILSVAREAASPAILAARHDLRLELADDSLWLYGDPGRLAQAVTNILNNAAKFTPRGGEIAVRGFREDHHAVVRVRDNGIGIHPEALHGVFEMFRQGDTPHRSQGGLGIGLALARQLVELHGGTIEARSDGAGQGAEFTIRLPLVLDHREDEAQGGAAPIAHRGRGRRLKVLVVDDNADLVEMLATLVTTLGHDVRKALDGQTAISAAVAYAPDVVLLDLGLPVVSGIDVARELRRQPQLARTQLVALTGWGQAEDRRKTGDAGFNHHLTKPADPQTVERLLSAIARGDAG